MGVRLGQPCWAFVLWRGHRFLFLPLSPLCSCPVIVSCTQKPFSLCCYLLLSAFSLHHRLFPAPSSASPVASCALLSVRQSLSFFNSFVFWHFHLSVSFSVSIRSAFVSSPMQRQEKGKMSALAGVMISFDLKKKSVTCAGRVWMCSIFIRNLHGLKSIFLSLVKAVFRFEPQPIK